MATSPVPAAPKPLMPAAMQLLGRTRNSLEYDVFDIDGILAQIGETAIVMSPILEDWQMYSGSDVIYSKPTNVAAHWVDKTEREYSIFKSGSDMEDKLDASLDMQAKYLAVSGGLAVKAGLKRTVKQGAMYALVNSVYERYHAELDLSATGASLLRPELILELQNLPKAFDPNYPPTKKVLYDFIDKWGTHVITGIMYGQRFVLRSETTTSSSDVLTNFEANIKAAYKSVLAGVSVDAGIEKTTQYKTFGDTTTLTVKIQGGDATKHAALSVHPLDAQAYIDWSGSRASYGQEAPLAVQVKPLYDFIFSNLAVVPAARAGAAVVQQAVDHMLAEYVKVTAGPGSYDGPSLFIWGPDQTNQPKCKVTLTFSGDPRFRIWARSNRNGRKDYEYDRPYKWENNSITWSDEPSWFTVADDGMSVTFEGWTGLINSVGYYHAARALEYVAGPSTDVRMDCSTNVKRACFLYGQPTEKADGQYGPYNEYACLVPGDDGQGNMKTTAIWKGVDLRKGLPGLFQPSSGGGGKVNVNAPPEWKTM